MNQNLIVVGHFLFILAIALNNSVNYIGIYIIVSGKMKHQPIKAGFKLIEFFSAFSHEFDVCLSDKRLTLKGYSLPFLEAILMLIVRVSLTGTVFPLAS